MDEDGQSIYIRLAARNLGISSMIASVVVGVGALY